MSVIQNFKKRKQREAQNQSESPTTENTALTLLAQLLNVPEEQAIAAATKYVESNISYFSSDLPDNKPYTEVDEHEAVKEELAADIENAASSVESAASTVEDSADNLAYTANDINAATDSLKEATAEIKKPSAVRKSTSSKRTSKPRKSTKK